MIFIRTCPICYEGFYLIHRNSNAKSAIQWDVDIERHVIICRVEKGLRDMLKSASGKVLAKR